MQSDDYWALAQAQIKSVVTASEIEIDQPISKTLVADALHAAQLLVDACKTDLIADHDSIGGLELYLKKGHRALLITLTENNQFKIFEDRKSSRWHAVYALDDPIWRQHLPFFLQQFNECEGDDNDQ